jgi:DNA-binding transcriptional LysR family regulator
MKFLFHWQVSRYLSPLHAEQHLLQGGAMFADLSLSDMTRVRELNRLRSVREAARVLRVQPSQVSRSLRRVENLVGVVLFQRSTSGLTPTAEAADILDVIENVIDDMNEVLKPDRKKGTGKPVQITLAAPAYLARSVVVPAFQRVKGERIQPRLTDLLPDDITRQGIRGNLDGCIHIREVDWPRTWTSRKIGKIDWILICANKHPLRGSCKRNDVLKYGFVTPVYLSEAGFTRGNDQFPIPIERRDVKLEVSSSDLALEAVVDSELLAFVPEVAARRDLKEKRLRRLELLDTRSVELPVYFSVRSERVSKSLFEKLSQELSALLR